MDQVFNFDKSLQQRLREYKDVFDGFEILPASGLKKEWGFYLELTMDPNGWQAIWKISRTTCDILKLPFPTIVLVFVLDVDFSNLQALVRVIAVQDESHIIPEKHHVPLIQLWPTKAQDETVALNLSSTANVIDMLRFFYIHLFMPWDIDDDETSDWKSKHLESRLRLYYDMKNGMIPKATSLRLNSLLTEARRIQNKKEQIELQLEETVIDEDSSEKNIEELTNIHLRLIEIKCEVEILENPLLRKAFLKRQQQQQLLNVENVKEPRIWLIQENGQVESYLRFLEQVKLLYPKEKVIVQPNLSQTLEYGGPNDSFILAEGKYEVNVITTLENGVILKGIGNRDNIVLDSMLDDIMLDFQVEHCLVENVTLDASMSQCAAVIRKGKVTFSNCKIVGDGVSTIHQGIIVLAGAELELINCEMYGFYIALVGNSGSQVTMQNTEIYNVHYGLKIYDNSLVNVHKCTFRNCKDYGVFVETENLEEGIHNVGNFEILNKIPQVKTEFVNGMNNGKGDVLINRTSQINAIKDLFSKGDPTISEPSDEDMAFDDDCKDIGSEFDRTVIESNRNISPVTI